MAQAIPTFVMSCFKLLDKLLHAINSKFWWDKISGERSTHWINWVDLCTSKLNGGLGFRDFEAFNNILVAKSSFIEAFMSIFLF